MRAEAGPLAGVKVVEAASFVSGPFAAATLADLGADVIKVEPPKGDSYRRFGRPATGMAPMFAACNGGKRSVVLDLKTADGKEAALALLDGADVFVNNWRPAVAARLGLADDVLATRNPRLIRVSVTGYGPDGPLADKPIFDTIVQGASGHCEAFGNGETPALAYGYLVDKLTAAYTVQAVLAALLDRERTGRGDRVGVAMLDVAAHFNFPDVLSQRIFVDHQPAAARNPQPGINHPLATSDGWIVIAPVTGTHIRGACAAVGHREWADELLAQKDAVAMTIELYERLEPLVAKESSAVWLERFAQHDVAAGPCHLLDEHLADPQVAHNEIYRIEDWPGIGAVRRVRYPARFASFGPLVASGPAPALGSDDGVR
jgi:crotonobetainyl-CoA:carnitine CoA-transferase CaiB-like acyl-CoA transferase